MIWEIVINDLKRNRRRNAITISMVAVAVALIIFMFAIAEGKVGFFDPIIKAETGHAKIIPVSDQINRTNDILVKLDATDYVKAYSPRLKLPGIVSFGTKHTDITVIGINLTLERKVTNIETCMIDGMYEVDKNSVLMGKGLSESLGVKIGEKIKIITVTNRSEGYTVAGIYKTNMIELDLNTVFLSLDTAQQMLNASGEISSEIALIFSNIDETNKCAKDLAKALQNGGFDVEVKTYRQLIPFIDQMSKIQDPFIYGFSVIILIVAGMGIATIMVMAVTERTRQIGILQALGVKPREIFAIFLLEAILLGLIGGILGSIVGVCISVHYENVGIPFSEPIEMMPVTITHMYPKLKAEFILTALSFAVGIATLFGLLPAMKASRLRIAEALRYE